MFLKHFHLRQQPFSLHYDPAQLWFNAGHRKVLDQMHLWIEMRKGFVVLTGAAGVGKTTLLRAVSGQLPARTHVSYISNPPVNLNLLLQSICRDFGISNPFSKLTRENLMNLLYRHLTKHTLQGNNFVLVMDNMQGIHENLLGALHVLSELESPTRKYLQVIMVGRPEFLRQLRMPFCRQTAALVNQFARLQPLSFKETEEYIETMLRMAGYSGKPLFSGSALKKIYEYSGGYFYLINRLCAEALLGAYSKHKRQAGTGIVKDTWQRIEKESSIAVKKTEDILEMEDFRRLLNDQKGWFTKEQFSEIIDRERRRTQRTGLPLSYVLMYISDFSFSSKKITAERFYSILKEIVELVSRNTRISDVKYIFDGHKVGILLVDTPLDGAKTYVEKLAEKLVRNLPPRNYEDDTPLIPTIEISAFMPDQVKESDRIDGAPFVRKKLDFDCDWMRRMGRPEMN